VTHAVLLRQHKEERKVVQAMFGRNMIKGFLGVFVAALFVVAFAVQASAFSAGSGTPFAYTGNIVSIDYGDRIITVQAGPNDEQTFNLDDSAAVTKCSMSESFSSLGMGDHVTVTYFEEGSGPYIASEIDLAVKC
jgi:hypothetical protein